MQRSQVATQLGEWDDATKQRIGEAYQWLLVPSAAPGEPEVRWEATRAGGSDALAVRASKRLRSDDSLIVNFGGALLRMNLDGDPALARRPRRRPRPLGLLRAVPVPPAAARRERVCAERSRTACAS